MNQSIEEIQKEIQENSEKLWGMEKKINDEQWKLKQQKQELEYMYIREAVTKFIEYTSAVEEISEDDVAIQMSELAFKIKGLWT